jgi:undecaprenyl-diphosphatase
VTIERIGQIDTAGMRYAHGLRRPWLSRMLVVFTRSGNLGLIWIALGALLDQSQHVTLTLAATMLVCESIKQVTRRERPVVARMERLIGVQKTTSFPSGHAASAMAAAVLLTAFAPPFAAVWFALAVLMAMSRVYVGVHYPSDVAVGAVIGILVGLTSLGLVTALF